MEKTVKRTKFGQFMYNFVLKCGMALCKARFFYYLLNLTWGLFLVIIGWFVALAMLISGHKPIWYNGIIYFETKKENWGGFSIGMVFVVCNNSSSHTLRHEMGHTYQNAILGPFMLFLVSIPSMIRYWIREGMYKKGIQPKTNYDDIWFEGSSSDLGYSIVEYITSKKEAKNNEDK